MLTYPHNAGLCCVRGSWESGGDALTPGSSPGQAPNPLPEGGGFVRHPPTAVLKVNRYGTEVEIGQGRVIAYPG